MRTSNLTGNELCYVVTILEMPDLVWGETIGLHHASNQIVVPQLPDPDCYSPFTNWEMVGPIIEREGINVSRAALGGWVSTVFDETAELLENSFKFRQYGQTPLIAAMRCYIASKLGDDVKIPEELNLD